MGRSTFTSGQINGLRIRIPQMPSSGRQLRRFASTTITGREQRAQSRLHNLRRRSLPSIGPDFSRPVNQSAVAKLIAIAAAVTSGLHRAQNRRSPGTPLWPSRGNAYIPSKTELGETLRPTSCGSQEGNTICSYFIIWCRPVNASLKRDSRPAERRIQRLLMVQLCGFV